LFRRQSQVKPGRAATHGVGDGPHLSGTPSTGTLTNPRPAASSKPDGKPSLRTRPARNAASSPRCIALSPPGVGSNQPLARNDRRPPPGPILGRVSPGPASLALCAAILVLLPWLAWRSQRSLAILALPRPFLYLDACLSLWLATGLGAVVLWLEGASLESVALRPLPAARPFLAWTAACVALALALAFAARAVRRRLGRPESPVLLHLLPRSRRERWLFALLVAPTAGIAEEVLFRGIALGRLGALLGSPWPAALLTALAFALCHAYQGPLGLARAALLGLVLAAPPVLGASLWPAIAAHTLLDLLGGLVLAGWLADRPPARRS
jgi:membrane protease YdiL (CAAX protease family)